MTKTPSPGKIVEAQARLAADLAAQSLSRALAAQLAVTGELVAALARNGTLPLDQSADALFKAADLIMSNLDRSPSPFVATLTAPLQRHADALRALTNKPRPRSKPRPRN
jgi:hypothetical protein